MKNFTMIDAYLSFSTFQRYDTSSLTPSEQKNLLKYRELSDYDVRMRHLVPPRAKNGLFTSLGFGNLCDYNTNLPCIDNSALSKEPI